MADGSGTIHKKAGNELGAHLGAVNEAGTYLIYTFYAGQPIDLHTVANRLLKAGVAETVYSAAMPEVRVAPRYASMTALLQRTSAVKEFLNGPTTVRSGLRIWLKYPRSGPALRPLIWAFAKVRVVLRWHQLNKIVRANAYPNLGASDVHDDDDDLVTIATELIKQMEAVHEDVLESVAQAQAVGAVQVEMDRRLLRPGYWMSEPYLRLGLRSSKHRFISDQLPLPGPDPETTNRADASGRSEVIDRAYAQPADPARVDAHENLDSDGWVEVEGLALLHRTGVVQVMLRVPLPKNSTTEDLIGRVSSKPLNIAASILPEPILEPMQLANLSEDLSGRWQSEISEGVRWREIEFESPTSLDDLFSLYFAAFEDAMPGIGSHWMCYPVLVADGIACGCTPEEWKIRHRSELAGVMFQHKDASIFKQVLADEALEDVSHINDMIVLLNQARGVVMHWGDDRTVNWADDLSTLIPIEQALLQLGQLSSLESQFAEAAAKSRDLEKLELAIITGLDEFRSSQINAGEAQILVERILEKSRALTGYSRLIDSVNQLHQKITAADAKRSARQANLLAFLAVLVAVTLGLPAIKETTEIAESVPKNSAFAGTTKPLVWLGEQGPSGVWAAFIVLIVAAIGIWAATFFQRGRRVHYRRRLAGRRWEVPLEVRFSEADDELRSGS